MVDYRDSILRHEKEVNRLHGAMHEAVNHRDKSPSLREKWIRAANEYRSHHSSIDDWLEQIRTADIANWADARDFIFQYLEIDPVYNNSGYAKELMVQKIKKCNLSEKEKQVLRSLIIGRIRSVAWRDFRRFCQLIPRIQNQAFVDEISVYAQSKDTSVSRRAIFAMQYISR